jgi:hypothetical protein
LEVVGTTYSETEKRTTGPSAHLSNLFSFGVCPSEVVHINKKMINRSKSAQQVKKEKR